MKKIISFAVLCLLLLNNLWSQGNKALHFDGINDHVSIAHSQSLNITNAITMEAWIYPTSAGLTGGDVAIISKDALNASSYSYAISFSFEKGLRCSFNNFGKDLFTADNSIQLNTWTHVACTYDGDSVIAFINGTAVLSSPFSALINSNSNPLKIGVWYLNNGVYSFIGRMDEIRVWNIARSENDIQSTMNIGLTGSEPGLVGYWQFNEGIGDTTIDGSGEGNTGILVGGPEWVDSPVTALNSSTTEIPNNITLQQNYPNPFNPTTTIPYQLKTISDIQLTIYDISGRELKTLVNQNLSAGDHSISFDASGFASGIYIYKLKAGLFEQSRKMLLLK